MVRRVLQVVLPRQLRLIEEIQRLLQLLLLPEVLIGVVSAEVVSAAEAWVAEAHPVRVAEEAIAGSVMQIQ